MVSTDTMSYTHDVFVSYSRAESWPRFVSKHFVPVFKHWLAAELGRSGRIFLDTTSIGVGDRWPDELEFGLSRSRVMVALWSRNYFESQWCRRELSSMLARESAFRAHDIKVPIIFPVVLHDCVGEDDVPDVVSDLQRLSIHEFADPFMRSNSRTREGLSSALRPLCSAVSAAIVGLSDEIVPFPSLDYSEPLASLTGWSDGRRHFGQPSFRTHMS